MAPFQVACLLPFVTFTWTMLKRGKGSCWHTTAFQAIRCQLVSQDFSVDCPLKNRQTLPVKSGKWRQTRWIIIFWPRKESKKRSTPNSIMAKNGSLVRHDTLHVVMDWAEAWRGIKEEMEGKPWWIIVMDMRESAPKDIKRWFDFQTCQESHLCLEGWPNLANIFKLGWNMLKPADSTLHVEFSIEDFLRWLNMVIHPECCKHDTQRDSFQALLRMPGHQIWDTSQPLTAKCQFRTV